MLFITAPDLAGYGTCGRGALQKVVAANEGDATRSRIIPAESFGTHARAGGAFVAGEKTLESSVSHTHEDAELRGVRTIPNGGSPVRYVQKLASKQAH